MESIKNFIVNHYGLAIFLVLVIITVIYEKIRRSRLTQKEREKEDWLLKNWRIM